MSQYQNTLNSLCLNIQMMYSILSVAKKLQQDIVHVPSGYETGDYYCYCPFFY